MGKCNKKGCTVKSSSFNYPDQKTPIRCAKHKKTGMIDVKHKKCEGSINGEKCTKSPSFNKLGEKKGKFCSKHKLPGMIDVTKKLCNFIDENQKKCISYATRKLSDEKGLKDVIYMQMKI